MIDVSEPSLQFIEGVEIQEIKDINQALVIYLEHYEFLVN